MSMPEHRCENATVLPLEIPPSPECDFCMAHAEPVAMWAVPAFDLPGGGPNGEMVHNRDGRWAACQYCEPFIERHDEKGLLSYVVLESMVRTGRGFPTATAISLLKLWTELFRHLGPREAFTPSAMHAGR